MPGPVSASASGGDQRAARATAPTSSAAPRTCSTRCSAPGVERACGRGRGPALEPRARAAVLEAVERGAGTATRSPRRPPALAPRWPPPPCRGSSCSATCAADSAGRYAAHRPRRPDARLSRRLRLATLTPMAQRASRGADDRRLGLRRRRRHPGRPEGVRALRRARHDGDHRAHRAEHGRGRGVHPVPPRDRSSPRSGRSPRTSASTRSRSACSATRRRSRRSVEALDLVGDAPVVVDPVMVAESGAVLLEPGGRARRWSSGPAAGHRRHANLAEARELTGLGGRRRPGGARPRGARARPRRGGRHRRPHRRGRRSLLRRRDGRARFPGRAHPDGASHGSGCTHSSALAAYLALGLEPLEAARAGARDRRRGGRPDCATRRGAGPVDALGRRPVALGIIDA